MSTRISTEIADACRVLFGPGVKVTSEFLSTLDLSYLKGSYRKMAWECHPDRAELTGRGPSDMNELFININIAYERLSGHIKKAGFTHPSPHLPESMSIGRQKSGQGHDSWKGTLPDCKLFIGQYLYYSDLISWDDFVGALGWQRSRRPAFGKLARMWNYLSEKDSHSVYDNMFPGERFGLSAVRQGYLTTRQRKTVLKLQGWLQPPIGRYFTEKGIFSTEELSRIVKDLRKHNTRVKSVIGDQ